MTKRPLNISKGLAPDWRDDEDSPKLVSLMALIRRNLNLYKSLSELAVLCHDVQRMKKYNSKGLPKNKKEFDDAPFKDQAVHVLRSILCDPVVSDQRVITMQIDRALYEIENGKYMSWVDEVEDIASRTDDLLSGQEFYSISPKSSSRYHEPFSTWANVPDKFPAAMDDIEEAEKCFALDRYTASVYHCMAVIHHGLIALGNDVGATITHRVDTWETMIKSISDSITYKSTSMPKAEWKEVEPFYAEAVNDLRSIKNAWRNPTMHFNRTYDEQQAEKIVERTKEFMIHLSSQIGG